jgi:hypothetical protein
VYRRIDTVRLGEMSEEKALEIATEIAAWYGISVEDYRRSMESPFIRKIYEENYTCNCSNDGV